MPSNAGLCIRAQTAAAKMIASPKKTRPRPSRLWSGCRFRALRPNRRTMPPTTPATRSQVIAMTRNSQAVSATRRLAVGGLAAAVPFLPAPPLAPADPPRPPDLPPPDLPLPDLPPPDLPERAEPALPLAGPPDRPVAVPRPRPDPAPLDPVPAERPFPEPAPLVPPRPPPLDRALPEPRRAPPPRALPGGGVGSI